MKVNDRPRTPGPVGPAEDGPKRPLYRAVTERLRRQLSEGRISGGGKLPPLRELARQFKVSTITVRQALRTLEQEGRLYCIPGVGSFVRPSIPGRAASDQVSIAFATIEIEGAFTSEVAHSIEEACQERGWSMQLFNAQGDTGIEARNLARMLRSGANAAIILPVCDNENLEELFKLKLAHFPFILVDRPIAGLKVDVIASDHEKGAYVATDHLIKHGHDRVLMVTERMGPTPITARVRGYERALIDHGINPLPEWKVWIDQEMVIRGGRERRRWLGGYEAARPVLEQTDLPVAIFALNSYSGWGVFEACRRLGLRVPEDVSIVCFDDSEFTRALSPPLTAVAQRVDEIGRLAVQTLERRLSRGNAEEPEHIVVDVDLKERESVATLDTAARASVG